MKDKRAYYYRNIGSHNKCAKIKLLKVIVSYVLNTVIPIFALMKSNRPTFRLVNHPEFSAGIKGMPDFRPTSLSDTEKRTTHQALLPYYSSHRHDGTAK